jgi:hypothetical protein
MNRVFIFLFTINKHTNITNILYEMNALTGLDDDRMVFVFYYQATYEYFEIPWYCFEIDYR